jgi:hypothetical protein
MAPTSALAIYTLFWTLTLFVVLPFGMRTGRGSGRQVRRGPRGERTARFPLRPLSCCAPRSSRRSCSDLFYLNYIYGWVGADVLDWVMPRL